MTTINPTPQIASVKPQKEAFGKTLSVITWLLIVFGIGKYSGTETSKNNSVESTQQTKPKAVDLNQEKPKADPTATGNIFAARQSLQNSQNLKTKQTPPPVELKLAS